MTSIVASLAGTVFKILVSSGDKITPGQEVARLESMKMEIPIESEVAGVVKEVVVKEGDFVDESDPLIILTDS
jgi:acetyl-CoA carboxylase biotin carboxyl carrier protein